MVKLVYFSYLLWKKHVPPLVDGKDNLALVSDFVSWDSASLNAILNHSLMQDASSSNLLVIKPLSRFNFYPITISLKNLGENEKKCIFFNFQIP